MYAEFTAGAFGIIDYGQIVCECDCFLRANLCAESAAYAADLTLTHNVFAFAMRRASHVYLCRIRNEVNKLFRAVFGAYAASFAERAVYTGKTVFYALDDDHVRSILSMGMEHIEE